MDAEADAADEGTAWGAVAVTDCEAVAVGARLVDASTDPERVCVATCVADVVRAWEPVGEPVRACEPEGDCVVVED